MYPTKLCCRKSTKIASKAAEIQPLIKYSSATKINSYATYNKTARNQQTQNIDEKT